MQLDKSRPGRPSGHSEALRPAEARPPPSRRFVLSGFATALVAGAPAFWPAHAGAREFSAADIYPSDHPTVTAMGQLSEQMAMRTDGRHRVRRLPGQRAHTESYLISQVRNGSLDMARVDVASLASLVPMANLLALPYLFTSPEHRQRVFDGEIGAMLMAQLDARALVGLCFYELGPRCFYGVRPVHAASDLEGLAVRVPRSGPWVRLVRGLGARPVAMPYEQIYPALKERTVDLAESNWQSFLASRHNEVARYFSLSEHMMTPGIVIFSRRTWDMLSPDEQVALRDAARESEMYMRGIWNQQRPGADTAPAGIEIVTDVDRRSFAEATVPLYQEQAATPQFQKMLQQIRDLAD